MRKLAIAATCILTAILVATFASADSVGIGIKKTAPISGTGSSGSPLKLDYTSDFTITADQLDLSTAVTAPGTLAVAGNTTLGDANTDTTRINGSTTVAEGSMYLDGSTFAETVAPEYWLYGRNGRWLDGIDVANTLKARDYVPAGKGRTYAFDDGVTNGTTTLTSASQGGFHSDMVGAVLAGTDIPDGTTVASVSSATTLIMSASATGSTGAHRVTVTQDGVDDLIYIKHRGAQSPTIGLGITPPDGDYRVQVASPGTGEVAMGGLQVLSTSGTTGHTFAVGDSSGVDRLWVDKDMYLTGDHSGAGAAIAVVADAVNERPISMYNSAKTTAYGWIFPGGNSIRFRYHTGAASMMQFDSDAHVYFYGAASLLSTTTATGLVTATAGVTTPANLTTTGTGDLVSADDLTVADTATLGSADTDIAIIEGHLHGASTTPSLSACGSGMTIVGTDLGFFVDMSSETTACTITFSTAFSNVPICTLGPTSSAVVTYFSARSTTAVTVSVPSGGLSDFMVICVGY